MAFELNGQPISIDRPYTTEAGVKYPHLRSAELRQKLGVVEVADEPYFDQRFYWGVGNPKLLDDREESDKDGNPLWVKVLGTDANGEPVMVDSDKRLVTKGLKSQWTAQVKATAGSLLAGTDWYIIRKSERNIDIPESVQSYRTAVVTEANRLETAIAGVTSVEQLIDIVNTMNWPKGD
jgi:hypothetical protein